MKFKKYPFEELGLKVKLTQTAIGKMNKNSLCDFHKHDSMIEIFYFISGMGIYTVNGIDYEVSEGSYLRIDPNELHGLRSITNELTFFYFGISVK